MVIVVGRFAISADFIAGSPRVADVADLAVAGRDALERKVAAAQRDALVLAFPRSEAAAAMQSGGAEALCAVLAAESYESGLRITDS
jgi:hypothetical protein